MAASVLSGHVIAALLADQQWQHLSPQPTLGAGDVPEEKPPLPLVFVRDREEKSEWVTTTRRFVVHHLVVEVYAKGALAAAGENPAEVLAAHVERILNWADLPVPGTLPINFLQTKHVLSEEKRRAGDKERVYLAELEWSVELYRIA